MAAPGATVGNVDARLWCAKHCKTAPASFNVKKTPVGRGVHSEISPLMARYSKARTRRKTARRRFENSLTETTGASEGAGGGAAFIAVDAVSARLDRCWAQALVPAAATTWAEASAAAEAWVAAVV